MAQETFSAAAILTATSGKVIDPLAFQEMQKIFDFMYQPEHKVSEYHGITTLSWMADMADDLRAELSVQLPWFTEAHAWLTPKNIRNTPNLAHYLNNKYGQNVTVTRPE